MGLRNQEIGWSTESKLLQYILKQLDKITKLIGSSPATALTIDEMNAIQGANIPNGTNVFATINDVPTAFKLAYTAYISQTGTNAPTEDIKLKDDIAVPVWSYSAVGTYLLTKASAFTSTKTVPNKAEPFYDVDGNLMTLERTSANVMTLKTYAAADTTVLANGVITAQYINIDIYI